MKGIKKILLLKLRCRLFSGWYHLEVDPNTLCIILSYIRHTRTSPTDYERWRSELRNIRWWCDSMIRSRGVYHNIVCEK